MSYSTQSSPLVLVTGFHAVMMSEKEKPLEASHTNEQQVALPVPLLSRGTIIMKLDIYVSCVRQYE
jgi:hypothetical protein